MKKEIESDSVLLEIMEQANIHSIYQLAKLLREGFGIKISAQALGLQAKNPPKRIYATLPAFARLVGGWEQLGAIIDARYRVLSPPILPSATKVRSSVVSSLTGLKKKK